MNQYFNIDAVKSSFLILKSPQLIIPHLHVSGVERINFRALKESKFCGVVLDKDGTLTSPYQNYYYSKKIQNSVELCKKIFGEEKVLIFSNYAGSNNDKCYKEALEIEKNLGVHVLRHTFQKPNGMEEVEKYFQCHSKNIVVVGDRYLTDIVFGNINGSLTIYTTPVSTECENYAIHLARKLEIFIIGLLKKKKPPFHEKWTKELQEKIDKDINAF